MNDSDYQGLVKRLNDYSGLREEFRTILGLLMAGDDDALVAIGDRGWNHWGALEDDILGWMVDNLRKGYGFEARLQKYFALGPRMVSVEVQHLMDDYWRLWTFHAGVNEWNGIEVAYGATAYALVRITGSRDKLPYTAEGSPRVAAEC